MPTVVWQNPRSQHRLVIHLAQNIAQQKTAERATEKILQMSRQFNKVATKALQRHPLWWRSPIKSAHSEAIFVRKNSPEIAKALQLSFQSLRNHLYRINQKLRTHNRLEAVMNAMQRKLI